MRHVITRLAATTAAALVVGALATSPAFAEDETPFGSLLLANQPTTAQQFDKKDCSSIPNGAKANTDGWLFDQPISGVHDWAYILVGGADENHVDGLLVDSDGVFAVHETDGQALTSSKILSNLAPLRALTKSGSKSDPTAIQIPGLTITPAPAGVGGGLLKTPTQSGYLQTPAGWTLVTGLLLVDKDVAEDKTFSLVSVCLPKAAESASPTAVPSASASPAPPALPVTGPNITLLAGAGVLLLAAGGVLFAVLRRRRERIRFVA